MNLSVGEDTVTQGFNVDILHYVDTSTLKEYKA